MTAPRKYTELCAPDTAPSLSFDLPELAYPPRLNAVAVVLEGALEAGWSARTAYICGDQVLSFADVRREVHAKAAGLQALGVVAGDTVILRMPDDFELVSMLLAVQAIGAIAMPTYVQLRADDLIYRAQDTDARFLIASAELLDEALSVAANRDGRTRVLMLTDDGTDRCDVFTDHVPSGDVHVSYADTDAEALCLLLYTSGSTGAPKGTCHCHRDMLAVADSYWRYALAPEPDDVVAGVPSVAFALGFGLLVYFPLRLGHAAVLEPDKSPERTLDIIAKHHITIYAGVVSYFNTLARMILETGADISSLRRPLTGGEPLTEEVEQRWLEADGVPLFHFPGTTEMLHVFVTSSRPEAPPHAMTLGHAVPGYEVAVLDPDRYEPVPDGQPGLLATRGPTGTVYWGKPDQQANVVRNGWNVFQDLVTRDADGDFHYIARHDDMIVSAGHNISPVQVENVLMRHAAVVECACVPAPDPSGARGAIVKAYVVTTRERPEDLSLVAALQDHVKQNAPPYMYPRAIEFAAELPKTINGKILRAELRRLAVGD